MPSIANNLENVKKRIEEACARSGRNPNEITLLAVTKTVDVERIDEIMKLGITELGENRVQELLSKYDSLPEASWHIIGHLQTNKVKSIIGKTKLIHSVDSLKLAEEIGKQSRLRGITTDILLEVNVSGEESKYGMTLSSVDEMIEKCSHISSIFVKGLMTMAPLGADESEIRRIFSSLFKKYVDISAKKYDNVNMECLSMGMSGDFEIAIEEGANIVRVGRGLFQ